MPLDPPSTPPLPVDALLLLNRATLVMHALRTAAHDLNNVLQMISGSAEMLSGNPTLPPQVRPRVEAILRHAGRGHAIIQAVAELARRDPPGEQPVDLAQAIDRTLQLRRYEHTRAGIDVTVDRGTDAGWLVRVDPQELQQMLLNLVINAEQALAGIAQPHMTISLSRDDRSVLVTVADNGPGPALGRADVFEPFVTTRPARIAAGLGLSATRLLATRVGGALEFGEAGPGGVAVLRLPAAVPS